MMTDYYEESVKLHRAKRGKIEMSSKVPVATKYDMSLAYTPGVGRPCELIRDNPEEARSLTIKGNSVAVLTDGSSVLGYGNIGPTAALPVMEGKALLFKEYAGVDAWPICVDAKSTDELVRFVEMIAPTFGGINLEDIGAPACFEVEARLQDLGIPVCHDDQHGTAAVALAGLKNAVRALGRELKDLRVVISGAGAAGVAIAKILRTPDGQGSLVRDVILCDSKGAIHKQRDDLNAIKQELSQITNAEGRQGSLKECLKGADVFIGVSRGGLLNADDIRSMASDPIVFALANPFPEIDPAEAKQGGAALVATGRSDYPNQVNNVLIFPGLFRGALDAGAKRITREMLHAAAEACAAAVANPSVDEILPSPLDRSVAPKIAEAVRLAAE